MKWLFLSVMAVLLAGCSTLSPAGGVVLKFHGANLTVRMDGVDTVYALGKPERIAWKEGLPSIPGLTIIQFMPKLDRAGSGSKDVSELHVRTADGQMLVLPQGRAVRVPKSRLGL